MCWRVSFRTKLISSLLVIPFIVSFALYRLDHLNSIPPYGDRDISNMNFSGAKIISEKF